MGAHARNSPSALHRTLNCTPSLVLGEQFADEESSYAAEGSAGHALAEHLIKKHLKLRTKRPVSDYYSDDLLEAVDDYVSFVIGEIEDAKRECKQPVFAVEQRVDISDYATDCFGTADMVIVTDKVVHIIDLKLGRGVEVSAVENPQLMAYGLGVLAMAEMLYDVETVRLTIYQPRINNYSSWDITPADLKKWGEEILKPRSAMAMTGAGEFHAGSWCRFCKAKAECRERAEANLALAQYDFQAPALLEDSEIADILGKVDALTAWASDVKEYALQQAISGKEWSGWKLVEGRSNRKYTSEAVVAATVEGAGYDPYERKVMGVTAMQKMLGKSRFEELLAPYIEKPQGKPTLVSESDKRPAMNTAKNDFMEEF